MLYPFPGLPHHSDILKLDGCPSFFSKANEITSSTLHVIPRYLSLQKQSNSA
jgi:hypothetical protein